MDEDFYKELSKDNVIGRHEASNISWISADGNRIYF